MTNELQVLIAIHETLKPIGEYFKLLSTITYVVVFGLVFALTLKIFFSNES